MSDAEPLSKQILIFHLRLVPAWLHNRRQLVDTLDLLFVEQNLLLG